MCRHWLFKSFSPPNYVGVNAVFFCLLDVSVIGRTVEGFIKATVVTPDGFLKYNGISVRSSGSDLFLVCIVLSGYVVSVAKAFTPSSRCCNLHHLYVVTRTGHRLGGLTWIISILGMDRGIRRFPFYPHGEGGGGGASRPRGL